MLFILGVIMLMAGVWFLLQGEVKLPGKRRLKPLPAQFCGVILLSFLPLVFVTAPFIQDLELLFQQLVNWGLALVCLFVTLIIMVQASKPTKPARPYANTVTAANPLFADDPAEAGSTPPTPPPVTSKAKEKSSPFDFS